MCEPTTAAIAMGGMGVAQGITGYTGAVKSAKAQARYQQELAIYNNKRYNDLVDYQQKMADWQEERYNKVAATVNESLNGQYSAVLNQVNQYRDSVIDAANQSALRSMQAASTAATSALEAGTTGTSTLLASQVYSQAHAREMYIGFKNLEAGIQQSQLQMAGMQAQGQSMVNQAMPAPMAPIDPVAPMQQIQAPSFLPYALQMGSSVLGAYAMYQGAAANKAMTEYYQGKTP